MKQNSIGASAFLIFILALIISIPSESAAHCDTMDGPVVSAARVAIEKSDLTPVLMWVREPHEKEIRAAFERTLAVRASGKEVREFADQYFFETLVRLHRQGEGEPYTGLKPAGSEIHPLIKAADKAIESGSVEKVVQHITSQISDSIRMLYSDALQKRASNRAESTSSHTWGSSTTWKSSMRCPRDLLFMVMAKVRDRLSTAIDSSVPTPIAPPTEGGAM
jgi:hypothetical protein